MEMVGRLTADAVAKEIKDDRNVVNFSIAINEPSGTKKAGMKKTPTYVNCSYWNKPGVAKHLTKGVLVALTGHLSAKAWLNKDGQPRASLELNVDTIKVSTR